MYERMTYILPLVVAIAFECITVLFCTVIRSHAEVLKETIKAQNKKEENSPNKEK